MFSEVQLTLNQVFGYLLTGMVILAALLVLFWALFWPTVPLRLPSNLPVLPVVGLLFLAYLVGHLGQAMGSILENFPKPKQIFEGRLPLCPQLSQLFRVAVVRHYGELAKSLTPRELYDLCDQALFNHGSQGEREILTYRESFYGGNSVALMLLALSLVLRLVRADTVIVLAYRRVELNEGELALAALLTGLGAWLAFRRYVRSCEYKFTSCFLRYLALLTDSEPEGGQISANSGCRNRIRPTKTPANQAEA